MSTSRGSKSYRPLWWRLVQVVTMALCLGLAGAPVALAVEGVDAGVAKLTDAQKQELQTKFKEAASKAVCDDSEFGKVAHTLGMQGACSTAVKGLIKGGDAAAAGAALAPTAICAVVTGGNPLMTEQCTAAADFFGDLPNAMQKVQADFLKGAVGAGVAIAKGVKFVSNPAGSIDDAANSAKQDAVGATGAIMKLLTSSTSFDPSAQWFLDTWAATAGLGFVIIAVCVLFTIAGANKGKYSLEEARKGLTDYGPLAVFTLIFGPAVGVVLTGGIDLLSEGIGAWAAKPIDSFAQIVVDLSEMRSGPIVGAFAGFLLFGGMLIGALGTYGNLIVQLLGANIVGLMLSLIVGMLIHPLWRKRVVKVGGLFLGILATKPALFLMIGIIFSMTGAIKAFTGTASEDVKNFTTLLMLCLGLLILTFAPWSLLKYMPLLKTGGGGQVSGGVSSAAGGAAAGAATSFMTSQMVQKANSQSRRNQSSYSRPGLEPVNGQVSTSPSSGPNSSQQDAYRAGRHAASKTTGQGLGSGALGGAGQGAGAGGAGAGAAGAVAGKSAMAGLPPLAIMMAAQAAAQAAKNKAKEHAHSAVHDVQGHS